jgi:integrase
MAVELEWCDIPKMPKFKMDDERPRERWLREPEISKLVAACRESRSQLLGPMVVVTLHTGLRHGELVGLRWEQLDLTRG